MKAVDSIIDLVGGTPLVRLNNISETRMAPVYEQMENLHPSGSVKDPPAIHMGKRAAEAGLLKPGSHMVESTSGKTAQGREMADTTKR
mgnify:CR=1 FL=1